MISPRAIEVGALKIKIKSLLHGEETSEGRFYATVGGRNVGEAERAFWPTRKIARMCAQRYVIAQRMISEINAAQPEDTSDANQ